MARYLVSGIAQLVSDVAGALREHGAVVVEVDDIADVPHACAEAGPGGFDGYIQLAASFDVQGDTAVDRIHHFFAEGVIARFSAVRAALPVLTRDARITFVVGVLPPEVSTDADVAARSALVRVLAYAARADRPEGLLVSVMGSRSAATRSGSRSVPVRPMGRTPTGGAELLGMMRAEM